MLLLDEIGELDAALQAKLLRVLQESRVLSVGDEQEVAVNVRVVAATNRDLKELVEQGKFRADLFHRLNVLSVRIPPLRERPADIPPLVRFFLQKHGALRPGGQLTAAPDFIEALTHMELPGNVRQLENLVCQALVNKEADTALGLSDLPAEIWQQLSAREAAFSIVDPQEPAGSGICPRAAGDLPPERLERWTQFMQIHGGTLQRCLQSCEREMLAATLRHTRGNQSQTARLLGLTSRSVYNKIRKYQLHR